jgi:DNA adenine methylase
MDTYFEPFVGGAAVFFALSTEGRFKKAVLADRNPALIEIYRSVQKNVDGVIRALEKLAPKLDEDSYYAVRAQDPERLDPAERTARLIYLNKTGYNGLYRVNRAGQFNVPYGRYKNPRVLDEQALRAASTALRRAKLLNEDFEAACLGAKPGDAVYFDPPYVPLSRTSSFTAYDRHPFGLPEHERLAKTFARLAKRGVPAVLSNSSTEETRGLYEPWALELVKVGRSINCQARGRGPIDEILVVNEPRRGGATVGGLMGANPNAPRAASGSTPLPKARGRANARPPSR